MNIGDRVYCFRDTTPGGFRYTGASRVGFTGYIVAGPKRDKYLEEGRTSPEVLVQLDAEHLETYRREYPEADGRTYFRTTMLEVIE